MYDGPATRSQEFFASYGHICSVCLRVRAAARQFGSSLLEALTEQDDLLHKKYPGHADTCASILANKVTIIRCFFYEGTEIAGRAGSPTRRQVFLASSRRTRDRAPG